MNDPRTRWSIGGFIVFIACAAILICSLTVVVSPPHARWESPQSATAFLAEVNEKAASIRSREMNDRREMTAISFDLYFAAIEHPELPEVWKTAASVINLRSNQQSDGTPVICGNSPETIRNDSAPFRSETVRIINYRDCEILLDGPEVISGDRFRSTAENRQGVILDLRNVHLNYRGGSFPPVRIITCMECMFDIDLQAIPPPGWQVVYSRATFRGF